MDRPLRVLFLNTRDSRGADMSVHLGLACALQHIQTHVWIATSTYDTPGAGTRPAPQALPDRAVLPLNLGRPLVGKRGATRVARLLHSAAGSASVVHLAWFCRRQHIDVVHVAEHPRDILLGLLLARFGGSSCIVHAHTSYYRHDASRFANWLLRQANAVIGVSRFTADTFVHEGGLPPDRVFAVHNAVHSALFKPDTGGALRLAMRNRLAIPAEAPLIGCVARLSRWKDQATLIQALAAVRQRVPGAHLLLAGNATDSAPDGQGNYRDYLVRRVAALGLDGAVSFAGFLPPHEMPGLYAALDVLAHPALEEPFGLALVEAMASGRPVVAVGAGGIPEIIHDGVDGLLVPRAQPEALAAALVRVLCEPALAERLAAAGRARVEAAFSPEQQATAMLAIYRQVIAGRAGQTHAANQEPGAAPLVQAQHRTSEGTHDGASLIY